MTDNYSQADYTQVGGDVPVIVLLMYLSLLCVTLAYPSLSSRGYSGKPAHLCVHTPRNDNVFRESFQ